MRILRLLISENWPEVSELDWWLLDRDMREEIPLQSGRSDLSALPDAELCEAILTGPQCTFHRLQVPPGSQRDRPRVLAYALEEALCQEPESQHFTVLEGSAGGDVLVAVVAKSRLQAILTRFADCGRRLASLWPAGALLPIAQVWQGSSDAGGGILRADDGRCYAWDPSEDEQPPWIVRQAIKEAVAAGRTPAGVTLRLAPALAPESVRAWASPLGIEVSVERAEPEAPPTAGSTKDNLLHGEFKPRSDRKHPLVPWKPVLALVGVALAVHLALGAARILLLEREVAKLREDQAALFSQLFPGAALVAPPLQTGRLLDDVRSARGLPRRDDFLMLAYDLSEALGPKGSGLLRQLAYADSVLRVTLAVGDGALPQLVDELAARGIGATVQAKNGGGGGTLELTLRRAAP